MDASTWIQLIMAALAAVQTANSGIDSETDVPVSSPGGQNPQDIKPVIGGPPGGVISTAPGAPQQPDLSGPTLAAGRAAAETKVPEIATPTPPPAPGETQEPGIGEVLAQIPQAAAAAASLLGINDTNTVTQRPVPAAGGQPGGLVGQFGQGAPQIDIGRLLAALPGIR